MRSTKNRPAIDALDMPVLDNRFPDDGKASCAATQEFPKILWNPKVHYCIHRSPPLAPIPSQINPVYATPSYLSKINFNIILSLTSRSSSTYFLPAFSTKTLYAFVIPIRAT
ncbi:hypothetical protein B7P43_G04470 [Cryptotermes secundus]|uniref:Uncharacterized protein n=1 Tax=Cryptotermes secundus TaxID=105785 RepID=A0A2J7QW46_9NEOP|nr:hypothetical protein B7P43_G04470 [Cryptotermes secundus]